MRFIENGSDIPDDLIRTVSDGDAVFLCGAGASMRLADMPSFQTLTDRIYAELGESYENEPAERIAYERNEFDRALRSLEKRTLFPKSPSRVRAATAQILAARTVVNTADHLALLQLSRDHDGRPRLLTTNFDTLFERAARDGGLVDAPSHAGKALPSPGSDNDFGVMHLHGRLPDSELSLAHTDLVLTSADFGDAYLRDGWASRYIEDRMRQNTLVLVGYAPRPYCGQFGARGLRLVCPVWHSQAHADQDHWARQDPADAARRPTSSGKPERRTGSAQFQTG